MSEFNGVEVIGAARDGSDITVGRHENANTIDVAGGHLIVKGPGPTVSAIYAPGAWKNAVVKRQE